VGTSSDIADRKLGRAGVLRRHEEKKVNSLEAGTGGYLAGKKWNVEFGRGVDRSNNGVNVHATPR
jgi:hypothetical protein